MAGLNYGNKYHLARSEKPMYSSGNPKKKVYIFNEKEEIVGECESMKKLGKNIGLSESYIRFLIKSRKLKDGFYYSHNSELQPKTNIF